MYKTTLGVATAAAIVALVGSAVAQETATTTPTYPVPYPAGHFVDNPHSKYYGYNKPDQCSFDFNTYDYYPALYGQKVKFDKKVVKERDPYNPYAYVYYIVTKAQCKVGIGYKSKKKITFKGFHCTLDDKSKYEEEYTLTTYDSKFVVKKGDKYGELTCKFKAPKENENNVPMVSEETPAAAE